MARVYATRADLLAYLDGSTLAALVPADPEATRKLTRASEQVDDALLTAVYDVDDTTLLPTDPLVAEAMKLATCAQVARGLAVGDGIDTGVVYTDVSIGSVRLSGGTASGSASSSSDGLTEEAVGHLRRAGLISNVVYAW
jgi:hypothetical protein